MSNTIISLNLGKPGRKGTKVIKLDPSAGLLKIGQVTPLLPVANAYAKVGRGDARKVRKLLRANGFAQFAAIRRAS